MSVLKATHFLLRSFRFKLSASRPDRLRLSRDQPGKLFHILRRGVLHTPRRRTQLEERAKRRDRSPRHGGMPSPPRLDPVTTEFSEEEEEELGVLSSSPLSATLTKQARGGGREDNASSAFGKSSSRGVRDSNALSGTADDEFAIDIVYVAPRSGKQLASNGAFAPISASSYAGLSGQLRRQESHRVSGAGVSSQATTSASRKPSIAGGWDSGEVNALSNYKGSDALSDADCMHDAAEYEAWVRRDARRRKDLLV